MSSNITTPLYLPVPNLCYPKIPVIGFIPLNYTTLKAMTHSCSRPDMVLPLSLPIPQAPSLVYSHPLYSQCLLSLFCFSYCPKSLPPETSYRSPPLFLMCFPSFSNFLVSLKNPMIFLAIFPRGMSVLTYSLCSF